MPKLKLFSVVFIIGMFFGGWGWLVVVCLRNWGVL